MAREVVVAAFDTRSQAYEAAYEIDRMNDDLVALKSGAILEKDPLGNLKALDTKSLPTAWGLGGAAAGALIGAMVGALAGPGGAAAGAAAGSAVATSAAVGAVGAGSVGAAADLTNWALKADHLHEASIYLAPGTTALVMELEEGSTEPIDTVVRRHGGVVTRKRIDI